MAIDRPDDWEEWIDDAKTGGMSREAMDWLDRDGPQWAADLAADQNYPEAIFLALDAGIDEGGWDHVTVHFDYEGNSSVTIDGTTFDVPLEMIWDYWDMGDYYGADLDKDYEEAST